MSVHRDIRPETRLKAAVIDRLFAGAHVDSDSVLISEMVVENWTRRADVVLANGKLWGFEIKSELDSLTRLPGQLAAFGRAFEKLIVVVAAKFEEPVRSMLPEGVGLWVELSDGSLREKARPKLRTLEKGASIALMTATELRALLSCNGVAGVGSMPRAHLEQLAAYLPSSDLANSARNAIKRRHRTRHHQFSSAREADGTLLALDRLKRSPNRLLVESIPTSCSPPSPVPHVPSDHPAYLQAPAGGVLRRLRR